MEAIDGQPSADKLDPVAGTEPAQGGGSANQTLSPTALGPADQRLKRLAEEYWRFRVAEFPIEASDAGFSSADRRMEGAGAADHQRRAATASLLLEWLGHIEQAALPPEDATTFLLLRGQLELIVEGFDREAHLRPTLFPFSFIDVAGVLAQQTPLLTVRLCCKHGGRPSGVTPKGDQAALAKC